MSTEPVCVQDIEILAKNKLEKSYIIYFESGADEEDTFRENRRAFQRNVSLKIGRINSTQLVRFDILSMKFGQPISMPICIAPTGNQKMAHPDGDLATVRGKGICYLRAFLPRGVVHALGKKLSLALPGSNDTLPWPKSWPPAEAHHTCMVLSYWANTSIKEVADAAPSCLKWCAVKFTENKDFVKDLVRRAENAGYSAIVVTCDSQVSSKRYELQQIAVGAWDDVKWLKSYTKLPVVLKGILTAEDAKMAVEHGADAILVSNHGERFLDGVPATIEALPEIVDAVEGKLEVYLDGGVRLGTDVFKALALGARAVFLGRAVIWGLAYQGEDGVKKVLEFLREEMRTTMILSGCATMKDITRQHVNSSASYSL
ncbi:hydroxyacid oxidase 1-like [Actinia tenebrosa]|uniref:Hydroxyacid oxidase 1-like n=1 Tax=Actinia tenebrosa TaxID=6105 RepID=A0A6P8IMC1_ACTTE|nr:hydroxyacid oxidase 1-like [Actinia tenebrosa]